MCRSIKILFNLDPPVTEAEIHAASLQYARKITGITKPSKYNEALLTAAVDEIAWTTAQLLSSLQTTAAPKNRDQEAEKAKVRNAGRVRAGTEK